MRRDFDDIAAIAAPGRIADGSVEADECRATRLLRPADESVAVASSSHTRSESGAYTDASAPASDLVRQAQLLKKIVGLLPRFFIAVTRARFATQTNVLWIPNQEEPNKAIEPTLGYARFSQGSVVSHPAAGVAHL